MKTKLRARWERMVAQGIVRAFQEGKSMAVLASVWGVRVAHIEAIIRTAMKEGTR